MTRAEAEALAAFVNRCGGRYMAMPLAEGEGPEATAWVLVGDRRSGHTRVPAWDIHGCLEWLERSGDMDRDGLDLLGRWLSEWSASDQMPSPRRMSEQVAALGPRPKLDPV
jgi:hypothetical protein